MMKDDKLATLLWRAIVARSLLLRRNGESF